ncbi:hypothetical protein PHMEG_0006512 [Phytophthora megakarya]|uniref:Uncharacterized protein n=1 Tax=Phytophthora megakarya TaxID=4795 RepID=A0A225WNU3_9STRA|nr:hypothetical protein PHMEG_0006512 [Phytophthora megakarya]
MVAFSIDEPTIAIPEQGYWGLPELASSIGNVCGSKGVQFEAPSLLIVDKTLMIMLGRPRANNPELWKVERRGYVKVVGATICVSPDFTRRKQSNLDLIELEYSYPNYVSVRDHHRILKLWGAMETLIVSHGYSQARRRKWSTIACVSNAMVDPGSRGCVTDGRTIRLSPVQHVEWGAPRRRLVRPPSTEELENLSQRLQLFGIQPGVGETMIVEKRDNPGFKNVHVNLQPGRMWGALILRDEETVVRLVETYGVQQYKRTFLGK